MKFSNKTNALNFLKENGNRAFSALDNNEMTTYAWQFMNNEFDSLRPLFINKNAGIRSCIFPKKASMDSPIRKTWVYTSGKNN